MLEINREQLGRLVDLAQEFHSDQSVVFDDEPVALGDDWQSRVLEPHAENPILAEFRSTMDELNPDEQQAIVALFWVGRGDYEPEEWDEALEYASDAWTPETADYLIAHPMLADQLANGLETIGRESEDSFPS